MSNLPRISFIEVLAGLILLVLLQGKQPFRFDGDIFLLEVTKVVPIDLNDFFSINIPHQEHFVPTLSINRKIDDDYILLETGWCQIVIAQLR